MQMTIVLGILFILIVMIMIGIFTTRRNPIRSDHIGAKRLNADSDASEATESEPELEIKEKEVDKMDLIPEENENDVINSNNKNNEHKSDHSDETDSEEYSMQRMVEEYNKSRTLAKKISEIIEDISDTFKRKSIEIKKKFEPEPQPAVIRPMSMTEKLAQINAQKHQKSNSKKKEKKIKIVVKKKKETDSDFDDEKQMEKEKLNAKKDEPQNMENVHMADSQDEFGDFGGNYDELADFESDQMENNNNNDAVEIINIDLMEKENKNEKIIEIKKSDKYKHEVIGISIEDEKVNEALQLPNNETVTEN